MIRVTTRIKLNCSFRSSISLNHFTNILAWPFPLVSLLLGRLYVLINIARVDEQQRTGTLQICPFSTFRFSVYYKVIDYTIQNIGTETKHQQHSTLQHPASQRQQNPNLEHASSPSHPAIPLSEPKSPLSTRKIKIGGTERRAKNNSQSDEISSERKKRNEAHAPLRTYGCANGPKCLMALDKAAQDPSFITGFCVHCRHKIHDRCGGRQEGDEPLICLQCKSK